MVVARALLGGLVENLYSGRHTLKTYQLQSDPWSAASPASWWLELGRRQVLRVDRTTDVRRISSIFSRCAGLDVSNVNVLQQHGSRESAQQSSSQLSQSGRAQFASSSARARGKQAGPSRQGCVQITAASSSSFFINICARSLDIHQADNMEQHYSAASARTTRSRSPADAAAARPMCACERARTARMPSGCMPWCPLPKQSPLCLYVWLWPLSRRTRINACR